MDLNEYTYETMVYVFAAVVVVCLFLISAMFAYILRLKNKSAQDVEAGLEKAVRTTSETSIKTLNKKFNSIKRNQKSDRYDYYVQSGMPIGPMSALTIGTCNSVKQVQQHKQQGHIPTDHCQKALPGLSKGLACFPTIACNPKVGKINFSEIMGFSTGSNATSRNSSKSLSKVMKKSVKAPKSGSKKRLMASFSRSSAFLSRKSQRSEKSVEQEVEDRQFPKLHSLQSIDFSDDSGFANIVGQLSRNSHKRSYKLSIKSRLSRKNGSGRNRGSKKSNKIPFTELGLSTVPLPTEPGFKSRDTSRANSDHQVQINTVSELKLNNGISSSNIATSHCECTSSSEADSPKSTKKFTKTIYKQRLSQKDSGISNDSINHFHSRASKDYDIQPIAMPTVIAVNNEGTSHRSTKVFYNRNGNRIESKRASNRQSQNHQHMGVHNSPFMNTHVALGLPSLAHNPAVVGLHPSQNNTISVNKVVFGHPALTQSYSIGSLREQQQAMEIQKTKSKETINSLKDVSKSPITVHKSKLENKYSKDSVITNSTTLTSELESPMGSKKMNGRQVVSATPQNNTNNSGYLINNPPLTQHTLKAYRSEKVYNNHTQSNRPQMPPIDPNFNHFNHGYLTLTSNNSGSSAANSTSNLTLEDIRNQVKHNSTLHKKKMSSQKLVPAASPRQKLQLRPMASLPPLGTPMCSPKKY